MRIQRILLFILLTATFGFADSKKVSHDLGKANPGQKVNVVIRYKHQPQPAQNDKAKALGAQLRRDLHVINAMAYTMPAAALQSYKVLDGGGQGEDSGVIAAIQRAIDLKDAYGIRIINLSLGRPVQESYLLDPLCQAVEQAWKAGIVVVVAAGNQGRNNSVGTHGYATISSPGNDPYVITVDAMNDLKTLSRGDDVMARYSSKGPTLFDQIAKPDLVAPGNKIVSALPAGSGLATLYPSNRVLNSYYVAGGNGQP